MDRVQALRFFHHLNQQRITYLHELAPAKHRLVLDLLPLLFHLNSPLLPGYIDENTPAGLVDYTPSSQTLNHAKQTHHQFHYKQRALRHYPLVGLYLINPQGWLHYAAAPSFLLWLVCSDRMDQAQQKQLNTKLQQVAAWAKQSGLNFDCRLLTESQLTSDALSAAERDDFYASGMVLAGALPYWWLFSPEQDQDYSQNLQQYQAQRLLNHHRFIDFGAVSNGTLNARIESNRQSLSALMLSGTGLVNMLFNWQVLHDGASLLLSQQLKQQIYQQPENAFLFYDPQQLKLALLQNRLPAHTLALAQQALYLQSQERLSQMIKQAAYPWRRHAITQWVADWGWSDSTVSAIDKRCTDYSASHAAFMQLKPLCKQVLVDLKHSINQQHAELDLTLLQRYYQYRFEPKADSIQSLPWALRPQQNSERLYLQRFNQRDRWYLHAHALSAPTDNALMQHESLLHILAAAIHNQLLGRNNWLSVTDQQQHITTTEVVELVQQLLNSLLADDDLSAQVDSQPSLQQLRLFINLQQPPTNRLSQQGIQLSSKQNDPLNYSSFGFNLVSSMDVLYRSDQGQWHSTSFQTQKAPLDMLLSLLSWQPETISADTIYCWCPTAIFGQALSQRLKSLLAQLATHYQKTPDHGGFLTQLAGTFYRVQWQQHQPLEYIALPQTDIWAVLAQASDVGLQQIDQGIDTGGLLNMLLASHLPGRINLIWQDNAKMHGCYVVDEIGRLIRLPYASSISLRIISQLIDFIGAVAQQAVTVRLYQLQQQQTGWQLNPMASPAGLSHYHAIEVELAADNDTIQIHMLDEKRSFSGQLSDASFILQLQQADTQPKRLPFYLSTLHYNDTKKRSSGEYLQQKYRIETLLNT